MSRCIALTKKQTQCKNSSLNGSSYCGVHQVATYCTGVTLKHEPCKAQQVPGTLFCMKHQKQATTPFPSTDCTILRVDDLLASKTTAVVEYRDTVDAYSGQLVSELTDRNLDHVVELHLLRDCYDRVSSISDDKALLLHNVRSAANIVPNLNFTTKSLNLKKHSAVKQFCDDFDLQRVNSDGLRFYLGQERLTEVIKLNVLEETAMSLDAIVLFLNDHEDMCANISDMMEKMVL